jgi:hypothetical protein
MRYRLRITRVQSTERSVSAADPEAAIDKIRAVLDEPYGYLGSWTTEGHEVEVLSVESRLGDVPSGVGEGPLPSQSRQLRSTWESSGPRSTTSSEQARLSICGSDVECSSSLEPALREHIERIQRALRDGDDAQLLGSTKELLESTANVVLSRTGKPIPQKYPALITAAFDALHIHPKDSPSTGTEQGPVRQILSSALRIALGINEFRGTHGTGHGRATPPPVWERVTHDSPRVQA